MIMEYTQTNRDRRLEARRRRMKVTGRGLLTLVIPTTPTKITPKQLKAAKRLRTSAA